MVLIELFISIFSVTRSKHNTALRILWLKLGQFWPFYVKIVPYSGLKIEPEFRVKYIDPGFRVKYIDPGFRVNLTSFASVAYWPGPGYDLTLFGLNLTRMFLEWGYKPEWRRTVKLFETLLK